MPPIRKKTLYIFFTHLVLWLLYVGISLLVYFFSAAKSVIIVYETIITFAIGATVFYTNSEWVLPRFFEKKRYVLFTVAITGLFVYNLLVRYLFAFRIDPYLLGRPSSLDAMPFLNFFVQAAWWWFQAVILSFGYWFSKVSIKREREIRLTREEIVKKQTEQMNLMQEKLELENAFLRAQINPHFLFNTLGYFYNKVENTHPDVAAGIVALTNIMRSSIKKNDVDGLVPLEEEIENIEHLISIYRLRFNNRIHIRFERSGEAAPLRILPHILITLVENAFKHGELHDAHHPLQMQLGITGHTVKFRVHNKKRIGPREISNGIGLDYVQRHLESVYRDRHEISIDNSGDFYSLFLAIDTSEQNS